MERIFIIDRQKAFLAYILGVLLFGKNNMSTIFYNIFTTNSKWQIVIDCYCWDKNVILVLGSNLNQ